MRILGIDPGYAIVGVGVIEYNGQSFKTLEYGAITTPAGTAFPARLQMIYSQMQEILTLYKPESMAVEKLYFNTNTTTAIDVAQAERGDPPLGPAGRGAGLRIYAFAGQAGGGRLRTGGKAPGDRDDQKAPLPHPDAETGRRGGRAGHCNLPCPQCAGAGCQAAARGDGKMMRGKMRV